MKKNVPVSDIEIELTAALTRLVRKDPVQFGFVVVEHDPTGRFFQFCAELGTRKILYDVPQLGIVIQPCTLSDGVARGTDLVRRRDLEETEQLTITEDDGESGRRRLIRKTKEWLKELLEKLAPGFPALQGGT